MREFTDNKDRRWQVVLNVQQVRLVRDILRLDLFKAMADDFAIYNRIMGDPVILVDLLYCLCRDQARDAGVSDEEFGRAMAGDAISAGAAAFTEELVDFFPDARMRATLRQTMEKAAVVAAGLAMAAMGAIERVDPQMILETMSSSSGNVPVSSVSTPTTSRCGSSSGCSEGESEPSGNEPPT
jgi:hypothetical protein